MEGAFSQFGEGKAKEKRRAGDAAMALWEEANDLREMAGRLIAKREELAHIDLAEVLFLWERETKPKADGGLVMGRCYSLKDHPIGFFTEHRFAIVLYTQNMDYMSPRQRAWLLYHELRHIPERGSKLVQHEVQDFYSVLREAGLDWGGPGEEVPDLLGE